MLVQTIWYLKIDGFSAAMMMFPLVYKGSCSSKTPTECSIARKPVMVISKDDRLLHKKRTRSSLELFFFGRSSAEAQCTHEEGSKRGHYVTQFIEWVPMNGGACQSWIVRHLDSTLLSNERFLVSGLTHLIGCSLSIEIFNSETRSLGEYELHNSFRRGEA